jgi:glycosyltransferase involved in cell wall biosynthesis
MKTPLVSVVLATYNGEKYLQQQLDSIYAQTYTNLEVVVCDDRSSDATATILEDYQQKKGLRFYINPERLGVIKNFEQAILSAKGQYIALADQDDTWLPTKIEICLAAVQAIERKISSERPVLVHTDLYITDSSGNIAATSYWKHARLDPSCTLSRLLLENSITGCTILMNRALAELSLPIPQHVLMHDVWLGMVASTFGAVTYLNEPTVYYRQHTNNVLGSTQDNVTKRITKTIKTILLSSYREQYLQENIEQAKAFKYQYFNLLNRQQLEILDSFINFKQQNFFSRRLTFIKYGLLKYSLFRNINMMIKL